jgi:hypothetical protein
MKINEILLENTERPYVCVHAKKGKHECTASSSYEAAKKAAEKWGLKSTAGIDAHLADAEHTATNEAYDPFAVDADEDDISVDADQDKIKHLVMQLRTSLDFDGEKPIHFKDGSKVVVPLSDINLFLRKYESVKPGDREKMQDLASASKENFDKVVNFFKGEAMPKSSYDGMPHSKNYPTEYS